MKLKLVLAAIAAVVGLCLMGAPETAKAEVMVVGMKPTLCLDVNMSTNKVALWTCHGGANQNFFTSAYGQQRFNGMCLDAGGQGSDLVMAACNNSPSQRWALSPKGELKNEGGWCVDVPNGSAFQGQRATVWSCNNGVNQRFGRGSYQAGGARGIVSGGIAAPPGAIFSGGRLIGPDGGSIISRDGAGLIGPDGGTLIGMDGASIRITGGAFSGR